MATLSARAIRVRTAEGWQDIAIQGAQGVQGAPGQQGPTGVQGPQGVKGDPGNLPIAPFYATGPQLGPGGQLAQTAAWIDTLAARQLRFTTPAYITRALIAWKQRWDKVDAAWGYSAPGVNIVPAPVKDWDGSQPVGGVQVRHVGFGYGGQAPWGVYGGTFFADLAANTAYTISLAFYAGGGTWVNDNAWALHSLSAQLEPR